MESIVIGARCSVIIQHPSTLEEIARQLGPKLGVTFSVGTDEYPPHELVGHAEALGWEAFLTVVGAGEFELEMRTEDVRPLASRYVDLSAWLAALVSIALGVPANPKSVETSARDALDPEPG